MSAPFSQVGVWAFFYSKFGIFHRIAKVVYTLYAAASACGQFTLGSQPYFVVQLLDYSNMQAFEASECKWFSLDEAVKAIPYPASAKIVATIIKHPQNVWAATFEAYGYTNPMDTSKIKFKVLENEKTFF